MMGISSGVGLLLLCCLLGLGQLFLWYPQLHYVLKIAGTLYLIWFTWKILTANMRTSHKQKAQPFSYTQAALFQFVNPKAWLMATIACANFTAIGTHYWLSGIVLIICFLPVNFLSVSVWAAFGQLIERVFNHSYYRQVINGFITLLIVYSIYLLWA